MWAVLDLAQGAAYDADQVLGVGEDPVRERPPAQQGPDALDRVELRRVGRQVVDGQSVVLGDEPAHPGGAVGVEDAPMIRQAAGGIEAVAESRMCG